MLFSCSVWLFQCRRRHPSQEKRHLDGKVFFFHLQHKFARFKIKSYGQLLLFFHSAAPLFLAIMAFLYLCIPSSLCLCFLDISKPPPHAPCTGHKAPVVPLHILIWTGHQKCKKRINWRLLSCTYVHMKPYVVFFTDVCDFIDGIKGSVDGGTCRGVHKQRNITLEGKKAEEKWV